MQTNYRRTSLMAIEMNRNCLLTLRSCIIHPTPFPLSLSTTIQIFFHLIRPNQSIADLTPFQASLTTSHANAPIRLFVVLSPKPTSYIGVGALSLCFVNITHFEGPTSTFNLSTSEGYTAAWSLHRNQFSSI